MNKHSTNQLEYDPVKFGPYIRINGDSNVLISKFSFVNTYSTNIEEQNLQLAPELASCCALNPRLKKVESPADCPHASHTGYSKADTCSIKKVMRSQYS